MIFTPRALARAGAGMALFALAACGSHAARPYAAAPAPASARDFPPVPTYDPDALARASGSMLLIPVEGIGAEQLRDSYSEGRSGGRTHMAIDIMAPRGTPVLAARDGKILRLQQGSLGGNAIYQLDTDGRTRYYYAHLERYAEGVREGLPVRRGDIIGYVGDTGNAGKGNYHLHFSIALLEDARRYWEGLNINPYPLLRATRMAGMPGEALGGTR